MVMMDIHVPKKISCTAINRKIFLTSNPCLKPLSTSYAHFCKKDVVNNSFKNRHRHDLRQSGKKFAMSRFG